jgi:hypothetical protein
MKGALTMDMNRIIGALFSGFACKGYAICLAVWIAYEVANVLLTMSASVGAAL